MKDNNKWIWKAMNRSYHHSSMTMKMIISPQKKNYIYKRTNNTISKIQTINNNNN